MKISKKSGNIFLISSTLCLMLGLNSTGANALSKDYTEDKNSQVISVTNAEANEQFEQTDNSKAIFASVAHRDKMTEDKKGNKGYRVWQDGYCYAGSWNEGLLRPEKGDDCQNCWGTWIAGEDYGRCASLSIDPSNTSGYTMPPKGLTTLESKDGFFQGMKEVVTTANGGGSAVKSYFYRYWRPNGKEGTYSPAYPIICYSGFDGVDLTGINKQKGVYNAVDQFGVRMLDEGQDDKSMVQNAYSIDGYIAKVKVKNEDFFTGYNTDNRADRYTSSEQIRVLYEQSENHTLKVLEWTGQNVNGHGCLDPVFHTAHVSTPENKPFQTTELSTTDFSQLAYNGNLVNKKRCDTKKVENCRPEDIAVIYKDTEKKEPYQLYYKIAVDIPGNERWQEVPIANCFLCKGINSGYPGTSCNDILQTLYDSYCITQANSCECMVKTLVAGPRRAEPTLPLDMLTGANCSVCMASLETNLKGKYGCPSN